MKNASRNIDQLNFHTILLIKKIMTACQLIAENEEIKRQLTEDDEPPAVDDDTQMSELKKILPEVALIDYVLETEQLLTFDECIKIFEYIPEYVYYHDLVWPIPYDFTPDNVYDNGKYDINLIFGNKAPSNG